MVPTQRTLGIIVEVSLNKIFLPGTRNSHMTDPNTFAVDCFILRNSTIILRAGKWANVNCNFTPSSNYVSNSFYIPKCAVPSSNERCAREEWARAIAFLTFLSILKCLCSDWWISLIQILLMMCSFCGPLVCTSPGTTNAQLPLGSQDKLTLNIRILLAFFISIFMWLHLKHGFRTLQRIRTWPVRCGIPKWWQTQFLFLFSSQIPILLALYFRNSAFEVRMTQNMSIATNEMVL